MSYPVIELRRYLVHPAERANFGLAFESYFPEAFQQLGAMILGQFFERDRPDRFTWIRAFSDVAARKTVNEAFYGGPVWREHKRTMNDRLVDHTDVLLLEPIVPIPVLPAVDVIGDPAGARGLVVAHIYSVVAAAKDDVANRARPTATHGLLVSLDVENNFPALPNRTDIPHVVALTVTDGAIPPPLTLDPAILRAATETVVLEPTRRSRLRWLST